MRRSLRLCKKRKTENNLQSPATSTTDRNSVPVDLLIEILNRLPAKSVVKFQLVSKSWCKIISSKSFIRLFPFRSLNQPWPLLISVHKRDHLTGHVNCYFYSSSRSSSSTSTSTTFLSRVTCPPQRKRDEIYTYYVNGLMSMGQIICNPTTGKSIPLPRLKFGRSMLVRRFFGYDPVNDEYKVLAITQSLKAADSWSEFKVFTLGGGAKPESSSWRPIGCSVPHRPRSKGLCIDGAVYYTAITGPGMAQLSLVRFDLKSEKFDIFASVSNDIPLNARILINYHGKVAIPIQPSKHVNIIDLRVFEAGKQDFLETSIHNLPEGCLQIKGTINNNTGEIIFVPAWSPEADVFRYNRNGASFTKMKIEVDEGPKFFNEAHYCAGYVESLMLL